MRSSFELVVMPLVRKAPAFFADAATIRLDQDVVADEFMTSATVGSFVVEARGFGDGFLNVIVAGLKVVGGDDICPRLSLIMPYAKKRWADAVFLRQLDCGVLDAIGVNNPMRARSVEKLLLTGSPAAIFWIVPKVVVLAIKRMLRRRLGPHIGKPILEADLTQSPSLTYGNAAPSIVSVLFGFRGMATSDHILPCGVERVVGLVHKRHGFMSDEILQGAF